MNAADGVGPVPIGKGGQGGAPHDVVLLPLKDLKLSDSESQVERRAHFDKAALKELAASLEAQGMLQAIVVRKRVMGNPFTVVAGERRYLAAQLAGWTWVPCNVRELTDQQVIELQLVENLQREGLHELAEAEAYEQLQELGLNAEQIAAKCGRSPTYVLRRLRLKTLSKAARRAFYDGKIGFTFAVELAKLPVHEHQEQVLEWIEDESNYQTLTAEGVRQHIAETFLTDLKKAPFPIAMASLVPKAGDCLTCPKRTAAQGALFEQVKGLGHCLDLVCFNAKKLAHSTNLIAAAKDAGQKVLKNQADVPDNYVRLDHQQHHGGKSLKQLLDKDYQPVLVQLKTGEVVPVAPAADAKKVMPKEPARSSGREDSWKAQQRAEQKKRQFELDYRARLLTYVADASRAQDSRQVADHQADDLLLACTCIANRMHHDGKVRLFKVMGWEPIERKVKYRGVWRDFDKAFEKILADIAGAETKLRVMLRILSVAGDLEVYSHAESKDRDDQLHRLAKRLGIDAAQLLKGLQAEAAAKAKPKKKAVRK